MRGNESPFIEELGVSVEHIEGSDVKLDFNIRQENLKARLTDKEPVEIDFENVDFGEFFN